jgi:8-oxo-dGTP diphosphatase
MFHYNYPRPALAVDCILLGYHNKSLQVLLLKRGAQPYENYWALPGGYLHENESADETAQRILKDKTNLEGVFIEQLHTFSNPKRDPREPVVSIVYYALVNSDQYAPLAGLNTLDAQWFELDQCPELAFDHQLMLQMAVQRLKEKVRYQPIGFELLPKKFVLSQLHQLYEAILQEPIYRSQFVRKILKMDFLIALDEKQIRVKHKPAQYYSFDIKRYTELLEKGFYFEL